MLQHTLAPITASTHSNECVGVNRNYGKNRMLDAMGTNFEIENELKFNQSNKRKSILSLFIQI